MKKGGHFITSCSPSWHWSWFLLRIISGRDQEKKDETKQLVKECRCYPCQSKNQILSNLKPFKRAKRISIKLVIIVFWIILCLVAYKTSQVELDWKEFDPYFELEIDREASVKEVKQAYHKLSRVYHPDKETGDPQKFMRISKAYQALTNEEAMENWKNYGNPDGPGATHFGIALPKWIVEKQNSVWVLGAYLLVFMVILPIAVGTWWYRSIQFSSEQILMDTARLYNMFLQKTPNMILRRVLMVLGASFEFDKRHNNEIVSRPSDNEDIPRLMKYLPHLGEKNKERPLCFVYSLKARALLHAHLSRMSTLPPSLQQDRDYVLKKCPYLLNEMISIAAQHVALAHAGKARMPKLSTIEHIMKLSQMVVQALWEHNNPLQQLPHLTEDILKHFVTKRRNIRSIERFILLPEEERRSLLRTLTDAEYYDVMIVCRSMPRISLEANTEVKDDEDNNIITAGSIVTVTVTLDRRDMGSLLNEKKGNEEDVDPEDEEEENEKKTKVWEKQKKKSKGKSSKKAKKAAKPVKRQTAVQAHSAGDTNKEGGEEHSTNSTPKKSHKEHEDNSDDGATADEEDSDADNAQDSVPNGEVQDEELWEEMQKDLRRENKLETKSKETHLVHCPYFPAEKFEWWWLYIADRKNLVLMSAPIHICSLKDFEEFQLKFSAPLRPGNYTYSVILRSDSYVDFDILKTIKLAVQEEKKMEQHKQWDFTDDEEEKADVSDSESDDDSDSDMYDD
ncbi:hypothetical protein LSH36_262g02034 [Paralvinella palmiformis]|uniref:J domain-containing protein n=1 Tax=Paralvinella palmiformis TaxID=53620 RepID=A0AAD9JK26_9ANNE|nr:hypothetical protein LSH36_262g02034 [Paralvinella palmiformis]